MASNQLSGGDIFVKKYIEYSNKKVDVVLSGRAKEILPSNASGKVYVTDSKLADGIAGLLRLYISRAVKSTRYAAKNKSHYSLAVATSPFFYDLIPMLFTKADKKAVILFHLLPKRKASSLATKIRFTLAHIEQYVSLIIIGKKVDVLMVGNDELRDVLVKRFPKKQIIIAHAGIDTVKLDTEKNTGIKDVNTAVFIGRLTTQKGILDLVDIAKKVEQLNPDFKCYVVGDGHDKEKFIQKINKLQVKSLILEGFVTDERKYELMNMAHSFIFPSYEEGWGIALAEALYFDCVSFTYELTHYRGLFADYPKYVELGDKGAMADAINKLYTSTVDPLQADFIRRYDDRKVVEDINNALIS